ncbi:MAG: glutathione S-transferase N-terminal domain-containing protein [Parvularculaceae bacterium]|nr:glutathione S-transferase N-terminal domain-containing protein [Parvularculaceae bacterium]
MLTLFELALADEDVRPSPYCWIVKFALLHKGVQFETKPLPFADKSKYPDPEYGKVPVLVSDGEVVKESAVITQWLDRKYPQNPLVASKAEKAAAEFYAAWIGSALYPALAPMLMMRLFSVIAETDKPYFRQTREGRFGKTLEEVAATPGVAERAEAALAVLAAPLANHRYLGGSAPNLADYIVFGPFMWQRLVTMTELYETPAPVAQWRERMLDLYGGYARDAKSAEAA